MHEKISLTLPTGRGKLRKETERLFAQQLEDISKQIGFRLSSRGWSYQLEGFGLITKDQFDLVQGIINKFRKKGLLPIDFTAEEQGRQFKGIEWPEDETPEEFLLKQCPRCNDGFILDIDMGIMYCSNCGVFEYGTSN